MGASDGEKDLRQQQKRIEDSQGMCGSETEYDTWWSRVCSPNRSNVLRDVLRGLLVVIALAIVITVIFLLCYFLLSDIENKEEEVDNLIKDFSLGNRIDVPPEFSTNDGDKTGLNVDDIYSTGGPARGDLDSEGTVYKENEGDPKLIARLEDAPATSNSVSGLLTSAIEKADDRLFNVDGAQPTLTQEGLVPFRTSIDSDIASPDGALVDEFLPASENNKPNLDVITEFVEAEYPAECVPLRLPLCSGTMPWALTAFPNFVNNNNINELQESLKYFQSTVIGSRCSVRAAEYACAILEPSCGPDSVPLPPCRAFCEDIMSTCSEFLITGNEHNSAFICSRFPNSRNPNVCVNINRASTNVTHPNPVDFNDGSSQSVPNAQDLNSTDRDGPETSSVSDVLKTGKTHPDGSPLPESVTGPTENSEDSQVIPEKASLDRSTNHELPREDQPLSPEKESTKETINDNVAAVQDATSPPEYFICDVSNFICEDGSDCLEYGAVCDGIQHCLDNTDELNCTKPETLTTPFDLPLDTEDAQAEATTELLIIREDNAAQGTETSENVEIPKRFSLSDMLSSSALVANPKVPTLPPSPRPPKKTLRFGNRGSDIDPKLKGKAFDSSQNLERNTFSSFGPFPFTVKPIQSKEKLDGETTSTKLSLAALLSSSSLAKVSPRPLPAEDSPHSITEKVSPLPLLTKASLRPVSEKVSPRPLLTKVGPRPLLKKVSPRFTPNLRTSSATDSTATVDSPVIEEEEPEDNPPLTPSGRSLSALLSSALPSFSSPPSRQSSGKCKELKCLDGTCISMKQLGDGIIDCPDGSDEKQGNHISLK